MPIQVNNSKGETVRDPYNSKALFDYIEDKFKAFSDADRKYVAAYVEDMRKGRNVNGGKGGRGFVHLNTLTSRLTKVAQISYTHRKKNLIELDADDLHAIFIDGMQAGTILKVTGKRYKSTHDYIKIFKAFWHWLQKVKRKEGNAIEDITIDLSSSQDIKPDFVFFTLESLKKLLNEAKYDYKVLMLLLFDSGIRVTELLNLKGKDVRPIAKTDKLELEVRPETSKTFGRKIKLMLSSDLLKEYVERYKIQDDDFLFKIDPRVTNQYLKRLSQKVFGHKLKELKEHKKGKPAITMYDFRHSSACYWLPIYKTEAALKWRFGWKTSDMIYYYTEFLNMKDTVTEDDMLTDISRSELEKQLAQEKQARMILEEQMKSQLDAMREQIEALAETQIIEAKRKGAK